MREQGEVLTAGGGQGAKYGLFILDAADWEPVILANNCQSILLPPSTSMPIVTYPDSSITDGQKGTSPVLQYTGFVISGNYPSSIGICT